jgi:branched-chain amino acid transport system permease protein
VDPIGAVADFFDANAVTILNGLARGLVLFLIAIGLSLIFGLMDVLNLAHGAVFLLGGYAAVQLAPRGSGFLIALVVAVVAGLALGAGMAAAVRPIAGRGHLDQALLTLGAAYILAELSVIVWGDDYYSPPPPQALAGGTQVFGQVFPTYRLVVIVVGLVVALAVYLLFERTSLGALVRATVADRGMVASLGVNTTLVLVGVFAIGTALAALGGVLSAPVLGVRPGVDRQVLLLALIVVVIGGLGSIKGALVGALLIGQVEALGVALLPQFAAFLLFGAMALVLLVRPAGLFGSLAEAT